MIKQFSAAFLFCALALTTFSAQASGDYVLNYLCTVFCPTQVNSPTFENIKRQDNSVANGINDIYNEIVGSWSFYYYSWVGQDILNAHIQEVIINHVTQESYSIAYDISNNASLAQEISGKITQEITSLYNRLPNLSKSVFREYIASPLHAKVENYKDKLSHQAPTPKPAQTYHAAPTQSYSQEPNILSYSAMNSVNLSTDKTCPICQYDMSYDDFVALPVPGKTTKIAISDAYAGSGYIVEYNCCRHAMHAQCALECFFNHGFTECPQPGCGKKIEKNLLEQVLKVNYHVFVPSAPAYSR